MTKDKSVEKSIVLLIIGMLTLLFIFPMSDGVFLGNQAIEVEGLEIIVLFLMFTLGLLGMYLGSKSFRRKREKKLAYIGILGNFGFIVLLVITITYDRLYNFLIDIWLFL